MAQDGRVILHLDMDAFYAAVEAKRLGLNSRKVPLGVVQYDSLIAVSYAARPYGVKRGMRAEEARKLCPEISLPHVEYLSLSRPSEVGAAADSGDLQRLNECGEVQRSTAKVSLRRYRQASRAVLEVLRRFSKHIEKASIDEVYVDVTDAAVGALRAGLAALTDEERQALERTMTSGGALLLSRDGGSVADPTDICSGASGLAESTGQRCAHSVPDHHERVVGKGVAAVGGQEGHAGEVQDEDEDDDDGQEDDEEKEQNHRGDRLLEGGAILAAQMRVAVSRETGYTMSAGVAHNKMLAKLGSSRFKPNRCTVVLSSDVAMLMAGLRLNSINGLRGKRGERVLAALRGDDETTVGDVIAMGDAELKRRLGGAGAGAGASGSDGDDIVWLSRIIHGEDTTGIAPNLLPKSINSFKSFPVVHTTAELQCWLELLAHELHERIEEDAALNQRRPSSMTLGHRAAWSGTDQTPMRTRTQRLSTGAGSGLSAARILACAEELLHKHDRAVPCTRLQLSVSSFVSVASCGSGGITNFFAKTSACDRSSTGEFPDKRADHTRGVREPATSTATQAVSVQPSSRSVTSINAQSVAARDDQDCSATTIAGDDGASPPPRCAECGQRVAVEFMQMHRDQHMAERLQQEWRQQDSRNVENSVAGAGRGTSRNKGRMNSKKRGLPQARIVNFFPFRSQKNPRKT